MKKQRWFVDAGNDVRNESDSLVALVFDGRLKGELPNVKNEEANGRLIAAAPELLENLIRCVDRLEENGFGDMSAVKRAKEAIEKATKKIKS